LRHWRSLFLSTLVLSQASQLSYVLVRGISVEHLRSYAEDYSRIACDYEFGTFVRNPPTGKLGRGFWGDISSSFVLPILSQPLA
jgi:hypothetical protein